MKKIIIFGAAGKTGLRIAEQALALNYTVIAGARTPEKIKLIHPNLTLLQCDILVPASFEHAIKEVDTVISAIGSGNTKPTCLYSVGLNNVVNGMEKHHVKRLICISAGGIDVNPENGMVIRFLTTAVLQKIFKEPYKDMRLMEQRVKQSALDYTIVRPPRLTTGNLTAHYRTAINKNLKNTSSLSRADLAHYITHHINDANTYQSTVHISY